MEQKNAITVETRINAPLHKIWEFWTTPGHVMQWNQASADWHTPRASNDLRKGGEFNYNMASRDGRHSFDYAGKYDKVEIYKVLEFTLNDGRKVRVEFTDRGSSTDIKETFEAENTHSHELQKAGWQAILDNFKKHAETQ